MKNYGTPSSNTAPLTHLLTLIDEAHCTAIMHYPTKSMQEKQCQWPGSLKVTAVMDDNKTISVIQLQDGTLLIQRNYNVEH